MSVTDELRFIRTFLQSTMRKGIDRQTNFDGNQIHN